MAALAAIKMLGVIVGLSFARLMSDVGDTQNVDGKKLAERASDSRRCRASAASLEILFAISSVD